MRRKLQPPDDDNGFGEWGGYMEAKMKKLEEQFSANVSSNPFKKSDLFAGISVFVNGLTNPSSDEIKRIMMTHGGVFHTYQRSYTTYLIAQNLPDVKIRQITTAKIISPAWIVDCLKEQRLVDYTGYLLYTNCRSDQPKISFRPLSETAASGSADLSAPTTVNVESEDYTNHDGDKENAISNIFEQLNIINQKMRESDIGDEMTKNECVAVKVAKQARTAVDPNFLADFYNNSRLHHIATLGAGFKNYISELREASDGSFPGRQQLASGNNNSTPPSGQIPTAIMHIDMDCFFVSVGLRSRAHLRGLPVAVTHSKGGNTIHVRPGADPQREQEMYAMRTDGKMGADVMARKATAFPIETTDSLAEIASCSYEARKMGIKNGMFVGAALKLCPNLKTIPYDFDGYKEVANTLYNTISKYTLDIEAVSCDEMYVNLHDILTSTGISVDNFVRHIRNEIQTLTGCPCSAGIGANRLQARMATKRAKPNGQFHLLPLDVPEYFSSIEISELPGVGHNTTHKLHQLNWLTCADLVTVPLSRLQQELGKKFGETLHQFCRGIDNKPLVYGQIRKSVSAEINYGIRFSSDAELEAFLLQLCAEVHIRLTEIRRRGKAITLKYMVRAADAPIETAKYMGHGVCDNVTKTVTLPDYTADRNTIERTVLSIKTSLNVTPSELRGIGIQITKLDGTDDNGAAAARPLSNALKTMFDKVAEKNRLRPTDTVVVPAESSKVVKREPTARATRGRKRSAEISRPGKFTTILAQMAETANQSATNAAEELDMNVVAELPDDIRAEVMRDYKVKRRLWVDQKPKPTHRGTADEPHSSVVDDDFLAALPADIRAEVLRDQKIQNVKAHEKLSSMDVPRKESEPVEVLTTSDSSTTEDEQLVPQNRVSDDNVFTQPGWRQTLQQWLDSTSDPDDPPLQCDVSTVVDYAVELVRARRLNELYLAMRFLHRVIDEKRLCTWHRAYRQLYAAVQEEMFIEYKLRLQLIGDFACMTCRYYRHECSLENKAKGLN